MHAAVDALEHRFPGGDFRLAEARFLLGEALSRSGRTAEARSLLTAALAWRQGHLGRDDPRTVAVREALSRSPDAGEPARR
jgi:hypothetical protein